MTDERPFTLEKQIVPSTWLHEHNNMHWIQSVENLRKDSKSNNK